MRYICQSSKKKEKKRINFSGFALKKKKAKLDMVSTVFDIVLFYSND